MITVVGTYQNGIVKLDKDYHSNNPVKVIITFIDDVHASPERQLSMSDFSFSKSQKNLESFKGSFGDAVIEERVNEEGLPTEISNL